MSTDLRSDLAKAKGLGAAKSGTHHWWHQRLTAIILVGFTIWGVFFVKCCFSQDLSHFIICIQKPYNIVPIGILVITSYYHAMLGMRVILEDYISCSYIRNTLSISLQIFCLITATSFVVALFYMMTL